MKRKDLYTRKTEEKIKKAKAKIFSLWLRSANSPYDIHTAYPQQFSSLKCRIEMFKRNIKKMEPNGRVDVASQFHQ